MPARVAALPRRQVEADLRQMLSPFSNPTRVSRPIDATKVRVPDKLPPTTAEYPVYRVTQQGHIKPAKRGQPVEPVHDLPNGLHAEEPQDDINKTESRTTFADMAAWVDDVEAKASQRSPANVRHSTHDAVVQSGADILSQAMAASSELHKAIGQTREPRSQLSAALRQTAQTATPGPELAAATQSRAPRRTSERLVVPLSPTARRKEVSHDVVIQETRAQQPAEASEQSKAVKPTTINHSQKSTSKMPTTTLPSVKGAAKPARNSAVSHMTSDLARPPRKSAASRMISDLANPAAVEKMRLAGEARTKESAVQEASTNASERLRALKQKKDLVNSRQQASQELLPTKPAAATSVAGRLKRKSESGIPPSADLRPAKRNRQSEVSIVDESPSKQAATKKVGKPRADKTEPSSASPSRLRKKVRREQTEIIDESGDEIVVLPSPAPKLKLVDRMLQNSTVISNSRVSNDKEMHITKVKPAKSALKDVLGSGAFTARERAIVQSTFEEMRDMLGLTTQQMQEVMQDWRDVRLAHLKNLLKDRLPDRTIASVRKFCQRTYHTGQRGPWSAEEDDRLRRAYKLDKNNWSKIAGAVGRTAEGCRDRWRDFVSRQNVVSGPWSKEEENKLREAVVEVLKTAKPDENGQTSVTWSLISNKLDSTRSAKQCRERYSMLDKRINSGKNVDRERTLPIENSANQNWTSAGKEIDEFATGDIYDVLSEIANCVEDRVQTYNDPMTFWSLCAMRNQQSRFSSLLRRRAFHDVLQKGDVSKDLPPAQAAYNLLQKLQTRVDIHKMKRRFVATENHKPAEKIKSSAAVSKDSHSSTQQSKMSRKQLHDQQRMINEQLAMETEPATQVVMSDSEAEDESGEYHDADDGDE